MENTPAWPSVLIYKVLAKVDIASVVVCRPTLSAVVLVHARSYYSGQGKFRSIDDNLCFTSGKYDNAMTDNNDYCGVGFRNNVE